VESRRNQIEGTVEGGLLGASGESRAAQGPYGVVERSHKHRHQSRSQRRKLKRALRQVLVVGVSLTVIVLALLWWRYLVTN
jgi:hypothetical protein